MHILFLSFSIKMNVEAFCECMCFVLSANICITALFLFSLPSIRPKQSSNRSLNLCVFSLHLCFFICPVVYEHRSRLEKSLQKERLEHKKAKEGEKNNIYCMLNSCSLKRALGNPYLILRLHIICRTKGICLINVMCKWILMRCDVIQVFNKF